MKIVDQVYQCQIPSEVFGLWTLRCRLCIFQSHHEVQIVMLTDMGFEMGWFVPSLIENLATQIVREFCLDPAQLVWIEHYTSSSKEFTCDDFSQVTFDWHNGQATNPQWSALRSSSPFGVIALETAQALISEVLLLA